MDESGTDEAECGRKEASGERVVGVISSVVNARSLQLERDRVLRESLLVPVLTHDIEKMIGREKERSRIWAIQMDHLRGLLGIRRMDKVPNKGIRKLCGVMKGEDEKIDEGVLRW